jgi:hypothetical protein
MHIVAGRHTDEYEVIAHIPTHTHIYIYIYIYIIYIYYIYTCTQTRTLDAGCGALRYALMDGVCFLQLLSNANALR